MVEQREYAFSQEDMTALWERACASINRIIVRWTSSSMTMLPHMLLIMREDLLLLIETVSDDLYGFRTFELLEIMRNLWDRYHQSHIICIIHTYILHLSSYSI